MLIIVCGLPGSGKTTLARALAKRLGAMQISSDIVRKRLFPEPKYSEEEKEMVYREMASLCEKALSEGKNAVVDATFYKAKMRETFVAMASRLGTKAYVLLCILDEDKVRERLGKRKEGGPSDADFSIHLKMKGEFEPLSGEHLRINSILPLSKRLEMAERYLGGQDG